MNFFIVEMVEFAIRFSAIVLIKTGFHRFIFLVDKLTPWPEWTFILIFAEGGKIMGKVTGISSIANAFSIKDTGSIFSWGMAILFMFHQNVIGCCFKSAF
jgi:uncharacterized membrane protein YjfL (UPF0719 family)